MNYYKVLEVPNNATVEDIKKAYKKLAFKHHPDKNLNNMEQANKNFQEVNKAFQILSDETKRAEYDEKLKSEDVVRHKISMARAHAANKASSQSYRPSRSATYYRPPLNADYYRHQRNQRFNQPPRFRNGATYSNNNDHQQSYNYRQYRGHSKYSDITDVDFYNFLNRINISKYKRAQLYELWKRM